MQYDEKEDIYLNAIDNNNREFNEEREGAVFIAEGYVAKFDSSYIDITKKILSKYKRKKLKFSKQSLIIIDFYNGAENSRKNREITIIFLAIHRLLI